MKASVLSLNTSIIKNNPGILFAKRILCNREFKYQLEELMLAGVLFHHCYPQYK